MTFVALAVGALVIRWAVRGGQDSDVTAHGGCHERFGGLRGHIRRHDQQVLYNSEPAMTIARTIRNKAQTLKGRITEGLGRVTRNRRLQCRGRIDRVAGNLKQAVEKTKDAFGRNGSGT
ncbi:CsbD family protein [Streptomyces gobiensis]|uniref:CsbD family protein n=1 Tax=Streptomyces gobiensis TaxID=2875706 RepID=UPI001E49911F|nr:CsbD family protein [Streptomyces gobiensis]UGY95324.1 CsbD family protein [Streptomyces gobiensis]